MLDLRLALPDDVAHLAVGDTPIKITCPEHMARIGKVDKTKSLAVYPTHLHCYGCDLHLYAQPKPGWRNPLALLLGVTDEEAERAAPKYTNERLDAYRERAASEARRDPLPLALADAYHQVLLGERVDRYEWLSARGLLDSTIDDAKLGHNGFQYTIPVLDADGNLLTIRYRRDDEYGDRRPKYMGLPGRNGLYLYPEHIIGREENRDFDVLVLCEGELDALLLWQLDIPAVSATNGARQAPKVPALVKAQFPWVKRLLVATDQDEPGTEAARLTMESASKLGFDTRRVEWSKEHKDVTECYAADPAGFRHLFAA